MRPLDLRQQIAGAGAVNGVGGFDDTKLELRNRCIVTSRMKWRRRRVIILRHTRNRWVRSNGGAVAKRGWDLLLLWLIVLNEGSACIIIRRWQRLHWGGLGVRFIILIHSYSWIVVILIGKENLQLLIFVTPLLCSLSYLWKPIATSVTKEDWNLIASAILIYATRLLISSTVSVYTFDSNR